MNFDNSKHLLNYINMDKFHLEFVDIYNSLEEENIEGYKNVMMRIFEQTKLHFCSEENLMKEHNYPRSKEHSDEHKKVLYEMEYFIKSSVTPVGKKILKSYYREALPYWFDSHLLSMDSDLASFLKNNS